MDEHDPQGVSDLEQEDLTDDAPAEPVEDAEPSDGDPLEVEFDALGDPGVEHFLPADEAGGAPTLVGVDVGAGEFWACSGPIEQAVIVPAPLVDAAGEGPAGLAWCAPSGETVVLTGIDCNGDGVVDLCFLDANGDGVADTWLQDTTCEPSPATGAYFADTVYYDASGEGLANCLCRDEQGTGEYGQPVAAPPAAEPQAAPPASPQVAPPEVQQPAAPQPAAPTPAAQPPVTSLNEILERSDDPEVRAQIQRLIEIQGRAAAAWI